MSELARYRKQDLITLAAEFDVDLNPTETVLKIIKKIESCPDFDKEIALSQIKLIEEERVGKIAEEKEEKDRKEREIAAERAYELEKLKIAQASETSSLNSTVTEKTPRVSLKNVMPCFDPETSDMALFLTLFQRHAKKAGIDESEWVTQLLSLMPMKIAEIIIREPEAQLEDFQYVKEMLLNRFKLSPEAFRTKFLTHTKGKDNLWKDIIFELRTYLEGWLSGLEIKTFEQLKDLMITDQVKRRTSPEAKEHMLDAWSKFTDPNELANKLDEYDLVRKPKKQWERGNQERKSEKSRDFDNSRPDRKSLENKTPNWREKNNEMRQSDRDKIFEKRKPPACYFCSSLDHLRPDCEEWKKYKAERINNLRIVEDFEASFAPYLSEAQINGEQRPMLRDTGSSTDVTPRKFIHPTQFTGEVIWLKQPLENKARCLPTARVVLEIEGVGPLTTIAAVVSQEIEMNYYILGNKTQALIQEIREKQTIINTVSTRSPEKRKKREMVAELEPQVLENVEIMENLGNVELKSGEVQEIENSVVQPDGITELDSEQNTGNQTSEEILNDISERYRGRDVALVKTHSEQIIKGKGSPGERCGKISEQMSERIKEQESYLRCPTEQVANARKENIETKQNREPVKGCREFVLGKKRKEITKGEQVFPLAELRPDETGESETVLGILEKAKSEMFDPLKRGKREENKRTNTSLELFYLRDKSDVKDFGVTKESGPREKREMERVRKFKPMLDKHLKTFSENLNKPKITDNGIDEKVVSQAGKNNCHADALSRILSY